VTRDLGRVGGSQAGRRFGRWAGGLAALLLSIATPAAAFQQAPATTTAVPTVAAPKTYAECLRSYAGRTNATAYCQRLFPNATSAATTPSTTAPAAATSTTPAPQTPTREPVDLTKLIGAWQNRPKIPPATSKPPADPLSVVPEIQAACAAYASVPERWRRCVADAWRTAGLRGEPPLVLQTPPVVEPPPPVVKPPPPVQPPLVQPPVVSKPPVQTPPPLTPKTVKSEPVRPLVVVEPEPPPVAAVEPQSPSKPPPMVVPPPPKPPATPIWFWLVALVAAAGGGFGVAKLLSRKRTPSSRPAKVEAAPCTPDIALVADPGVVVLTPDGPPRAGMAVSLRIEPDAGGGEVKLDYPTLETAP
jgi:hypothetical protein